MGAMLSRGSGQGLREVPFVSGVLRTDARARGAGC